jgi:hypothetical protein
MPFKLNDTVTWTSQAQGFSKTKEGIVAEVVAPNEMPTREKFLHLYKNAGVGFPRNHESYVIMVKNTPYWPHANKLKLVKKAPEWEEVKETRKEIKEVIPASDFSDALQEYYNYWRKSQRLGQFLCNEFSIPDNDIFYEESDKITIERFTKYLS